MIDLSIHTIFCTTLLRHSEKKSYCKTKESTDSCYTQAILNLKRGYEWSSGRAPVLNNGALLSAIQSNIYERSLYKSVT